MASGTKRTKFLFDKQPLTSREACILKERSPDLNTHITGPDLGETLASYAGQIHTQCMPTITCQYHNVGHAAVIIIWNADGCYFNKL